jgi:DNA polymerase-3 subunit alpha
MDYTHYMFNFDGVYPVIEKYLSIFKDDFYFELQNHGYPEQVMVNHALNQLSKEYGVKLIATNDVHYINKDDYDAHTILICLNTGKDIDDTEGLHYTGNEFLKTPDEMIELFSAFPEAIENTQLIVDKIESYELHRDVALPIFPIPEAFTDEITYLEHLAWEGARVRWKEITPEIQERMDFELSVIKNMGFPGYFLIVWDFIKEARRMGVRVGPGRGSAAGSAVAYCLEITNIDPIKYKLLFERFLNPERISMPDVDIDFDDFGREKVMAYVIKKYGKEKVSQIITFGSMAARSAIRDVARVLKLPLAEADRLAKLIPEGPKVKIADAIAKVPELLEASQNGSDLVRKTLRFAQTLEGSVRNTGVHACGVIIGPEDLTNFAPIGRAKDSDIPVTQYEGKLVESVGLLKMDFLGLKTLSIIQDTLINIKLRHNIDLDIETIPIDDEKTYQLFSNGETTAVFQFESTGMKKYLQELKPNRFEDIIAMNALYRPGPMQYIPNFINRKSGKEAIEYAYPIMEEFLDETYGITVYQEQVMLLSQAMAGFTKGEADTLRKAMGKKQINVMQKLKTKFIEGCIEREMDKAKVEKIWHDWEAFAEYAFNKSHSTCYAYVAYQTAYLKAHYPAEFMAANLTNNLSNIEEISKFIEEAKRMKINVLGPDVNESQLKFTVNKSGEIRFGLGAIKGVGEAAVEAIIEERNTNGVFTSIFDYMKRANLRSCNKRVIESLAKGGAFDSFKTIHRAQFFFVDKDNTSYVEKLIRYATNYQESKNSAQVSLFGDENGDEQLPDPSFPECEAWNNLQQLKFENEVTGFYISGHPLDNYSIALNSFCNVKIEKLNESLRNFINKEISFGGVVTAVQHNVGKNGNPYGRITIEDYSAQIQLTLFKEDYLKFKHFFEIGLFVYLKVRISIPTWKKEENPEPDMKVVEMMLLSNVIEKYAKSVTVEFNINEVNSALIDLLSNMVVKQSGNCALKIKIVSSEEKALEFLSNKYRVNIVDFIQEVKNYDFKIKVN